VTELSVLGRLERRVAGYGARRAVVAFSGGVDSSVTLAVAARTLGRRRVTAVTAVSPSLPRGELDSARATAATLGVPHRTVATEEVDREAYARNDDLRCFHCKAELFATLGRIAELGVGTSSVVLSGANADDAGDLRPGLRAGELFGVRSPLLEEGLGKREVRAVALGLGLAVSDKPALACLSSRVAFGIRITPELLDRIDAAEGAVRELGFEQVRVRHLGDRASIEVPEPEVPRLRALAPDVAGRLRGLGWDRVDVDPRGYRQGSMNETLLPIRSVRSAAASASAPRGSRRSS
jgi:pyridinium-3,5-biscarboxylic acid mononucleotide sulfurtransferase